MQVLSSQGDRVDVRAPSPPGQSTYSFQSPGRPSSGLWPRVSGAQNHHLRWDLATPFVPIPAATVAKIKTGARPSGGPTKWVIK